MDGEAVKQITNIAMLSKRSENLCVKGPGEFGDTYWMEQHDGSWRREFAEPPPRRYEALSKDAFCTLALEWKCGPPQKMKIFVGPQRVVAVADADGQRREGVYLPLKKLALTRALEVSGKMTFDQEPLIDWLKAVGLLDSRGPTIAAIRSLKFHKTTEGETNTQDKLKGVGRSVLMQVSSPDGDIPSSIEFTTSVFDVGRDVPSMEAKFSVDMRVDLEAENFILTWSLDKFADVISGAMAVLRDEIAATCRGDHVDLIECGDPKCGW